MTNGYTRPFSPSGQASIVPALPWQFAGDLLLLHFRADPAALARYLPPPLTPVDDSGEAFLWSPRLVCHPVGQDPSTLNPARTFYNVCVVGLPAMLNGSRTLYSAFQWGDRDWLMAISWFIGACSKLAQIEQSGEHALLPGRQTINRQVTRHGESVVRMSFTPDKEVTLEDMGFYFKSLPLTSMRHIPDCHIPPIGRPLVHDLTQMVMSEVHFGTPSTGPATLSFGNADNEDLMPLQPQKVFGGYRVPMRFVLEGVRVVHSYLNKEL